MSYRERPNWGPSRSEPTITASQLSGTGNTGAHHHPAPMGTRAPSAYHSRQAYSSHQSRRSQPKEAVLGAHHAPAPPSHGSRRSDRPEAEHPTTVEGRSSHSSKFAEELDDDESSHGYHDDDEPLLRHERGEGPSRSHGNVKATGNSRARKLGDHEKVPKLLWFLAGGYPSKRPTAKQYRARKEAEREHRRK